MDASAECRNNMPRLRIVKRNIEVMAVLMTLAAWVWAFGLLAHSLKFLG